MGGFSSLTLCGRKVYLHYIRLVSASLKHHHDHFILYSAKMQRMPFSSESEVSGGWGKLVALDHFDVRTATGQRTTRKVALGDYD